MRNNPVKDLMKTNKPVSEMSKAERRAYLKSASTNVKDSLVVHSK